MFQKEKSYKRLNDTKMCIRDSCFVLRLCFFRDRLCRIGIIAEHRLSLIHIFLSVRYPTLFSGKIFSHMFSDMLELFSRLRIPWFKIHHIEDRKKSEFPSNDYRYSAVGDVGYYTQFKENQKDVYKRQCQYRLTQCLSGGNKLYDRRICITLFMEHRRLLGRLCI